MTELFNVVFSGEVTGRADPAAVRANVGKLFNAGDAVLDRLFSGQPVAIKKMVDRATAMKLRALMKQAGAETRMVAVDEQGRPLAEASPTAAPVPTPASTPAPVPAQAPAARPVASMAERVQRLAEAQAREAAARPAPVAADGDTLKLHPVGTRLSDPLPAPPPPPDVSGVTLAPPGRDLVAPGEISRPAPVQVDISALSMAAAGTEVLREDERPRVAVVQVDISGMSMAEVGAPLDEIREEKPAVNPDISHLKIVAP
jgi:hypothetical protein